MVNSMDSIVEHIENIDEVIKKREKPSFFMRIANAKRLNYNIIESTTVWGGLSIGVFGIIYSFTKLYEGSSITTLIYFIYLILSYTTIVLTWVLLGLCVIRETIPGIGFKVKILKKLKDELNRNNVKGQVYMDEISKNINLLPRWWWERLDREIEDLKHQREEHKELSEVLELSVKDCELMKNVEGDDNGLNIKIGGAKSDVEAMHGKLNE